MKNYKLLPFQDDNYNFVYEVKKNAYIEYVKANWGIWDEEKQKELFKTFIDTYKKQIYIIYYNDQKIGFYQGFTLENGDYEIGNICIIPEAQGMGLGTAILNDILEKYKEKNIYIQYFKQNPVGNLYERLGFIYNNETQYHYQMLKKAKKQIK